MGDNTTSLDFDARYSVDGYRGIAFYLIGFYSEPDEDTEWTGIEQVDESRVIAVMVGDDRKHLIDVDDLTPLDDEDLLSVRSDWLHTRRALVVKINVYPHTRGTPRWSAYVAWQLAKEKKA